MISEIAVMMMATFLTSTALLIITVLPITVSSAIRQALLSLTNYDEELKALVTAVGRRKRRIVIPDLDSNYSLATSLVTSWCWCLSG
jgi:hypothetical protein